MMESQTLSGLIGAGGALAGTLIGAWITWKTARAAERRRNAVRLYDVFTSSEMHAIRHTAVAYLRSKINVDPPLSFYGLHEAADADEMIKEKLLSVSQLLHFWERTFRLIEDGYVEEAVARKLLEHYFVSHYQNFLFRFGQAGSHDPDSYRKWYDAVSCLASRWQVPDSAPIK